MWRFTDRARLPRRSTTRQTAAPSATARWSIGPDKVSQRQVALKLAAGGDLDHRFRVTAAWPIEKLQHHRRRRLPAPRRRTRTRTVRCSLRFASGLSAASPLAGASWTRTQALDVVVQLISACAPASGRTLHGDVKPLNIVLVDLPDKRPFDDRPRLGPHRVSHRHGGRLAGHSPSGSPALSRRIAPHFLAGAVLVLPTWGKYSLPARTATSRRPHGRWRAAVLADRLPDLPGEARAWVCSPARAGRKASRVRSRAPRPRGFALLLPPRAAQTSAASHAACIGTSEAAAAEAGEALIPEPEARAPAAAR